MASTGLIFEKFSIRAALLCSVLRALRFDVSFAKIENLMSFRHSASLCRSTLFHRHLSSPASPLCAHNARWRSPAGMARMHAVRRLRGQRAIQERVCGMRRMRQREARVFAYKPIYLPEFDTDENVENVKIVVERSGLKLSDVINHAEEQNHIHMTCKTALNRK